MQVEKKSNQKDRRGDGDRKPLQSLLEVAELADPLHTVAAGQLDVGSHLALRF